MKYVYHEAELSHFGQIFCHTIGCMFSGKLSEKFHFCILTKEEDGLAERFVSQKTIHVIFTLEAVGV
jgi:hypothetical protein